MRQASKIGLRPIIQMRSADHDQRVCRARPRSDGNRLTFAAKRDTVGSTPEELDKLHQIHRLMIESTASKDQLSKALGELKQVGPATK